MCTHSEETCTIQSRWPNQYFGCTCKLCARCTFVSYRHVQCTNTDNVGNWKEAEKFVELNNVLADYSIDRLAARNCGIYLPHFFYPSYWIPPSPIFCYIYHTSFAFSSSSFLGFITTLVLIQRPALCVKIYNRFYIYDVDNIS